MSIGAPLLAFAFLLSVAMVAALRRLSPRLGLVDRPSARKVHVGLVPLCGGLAMFIAFASVILLRSLQASAPPAAELLVLTVALAMLAGIGLVDDLHNIGAGMRLVVQGLAAAVLLGGWGVATGTTMMLALPLAGALPGWITLLVAFLFLVGVTNAFNMIDGLDGLAGGVAAIALGGIALAAMATDRPAIAEGSLLLLAVVLGFLVFNMRSPWRARATVFMGDAGSLMLGGAIAAFIVSLSSIPGSSRAEAEVHALFPALLWLVALPVIDTLSLMVRRSIAGRSPMAADRAHLHHLLVDHGLSPARATATLVAVSALLAAVGLAGILLDWPAYWMLGGLALPALAHSAFVRFGHRGGLAAVDHSLAASPEAAE
ncbi:undecaprenyl-phosphate alpha-N-acetylglucosaminyl 1-phosphate transferase [Kaistia sp. 32K]|uniref:glycosyltransferase family 4 protein n=1 Tax=Kaistia sp. 32K TaxID=2795690 RepID=UPI001915E21F|nr:MraY family glycosyltransferase [Kaistia sp. 32K]BCP53495.1 undecaprenyl-phosphate alpha-N-acetylglucosaminyl 1-phosphate transferase [Kaistia sp. 32K]